MAAPALAASIADWAICSGVTGTAGFRPGVSAEPVTAQEIITLRCIPPSLGTEPRWRRSLARAGGRSPAIRRQADQRQRHQLMPALSRPTRMITAWRALAAAGLPRIVHCAKAP